ncbi:MAG: DUF222 domain-containing protein [Mycobacteriales bacterium]
MFDSAGPELAASLAVVDSTTVDDAALVDALCGWERLASWAAAGQLTALAELARRRRPGPSPGSADQGHPGLPSVSEFAVDEVAAALRLSRCAAGTRLHVAVEVAQRLPETAAALHRGDLDLLKVRRIVEATAPLPAGAASLVERRVLPRAATQTLGQLRTSLMRAVLAVDPADAEERHRRAVADRRVGGSGVRDAGGDRAAGAGLPAGDGERAGGVRLRAEVQLTVPAGTVLGLSDEPGELAGHGPVPASMARRLAAHGTWRRILTDPLSGAVLDVGRRSYLPPVPLAEHVRARDRTCRFPGCRQPARRCDLDHTVPYPRGSTAAGNLAALCRHHHRLKHLAGWRVEQPEPGVLVWTSPAGHRYRTHPPAA